MSAPDDPDRDREDATPLPPPERESALDMAHDMPVIPLAETVRAATEPAKPVAAAAVVAAVPDAVKVTPTGSMKPIAKAGSTLPAARPAVRPSPSFIPSVARPKSASTAPVIAKPEQTAVDPRPAGAKDESTFVEPTLVERTLVDPEPVRESAAKLDAPPSGPVKLPATAAEVAAKAAATEAKPAPRADTENEPTNVDPKPTDTKVRLASSPSIDGSAIDAAIDGSATDAKPVATDAKPVATDAKPAATDAKPAATDAKPAATDAKAAATDAKATKAAKAVKDAKDGATPANPPHTPKSLLGARLTGLGLALFIVGAIIGVGTFFGTAQSGGQIAGGVLGGLGLAIAIAGTRIYPFGDRDFFVDAADLLAREGAIPALLVVTGILVVLYAGMFGGELIGDDLSFHMAESRRIATCISVGDFDWWNPSANGGFASAYYYQVVPQLASAIPAAIFGTDHFLFFFQLSVFLPLVLAPAAAYRGMRLLGATPWQALFAAVAVGFMNGESRWGAGNSGTFQVGLYTQTWALAAMPLALGHIARWTREGRSLAPAIFWGTFVWLCHPFSGISLAVIVMIAFFFRIFGLLLAMLLHAIAGKPRLVDPDYNPIHRSVLALLNRWSAPVPEWMPVARELGRAVLVGVLFAIAWSPIYLPLLADKAGFGGFPHRVADEVGPGFTTLWQWWKNGAVMDFAQHIKFPILTWLFPAMLLIARGPFYRYLWWPAILFALLLGLGPHVGTTQNDLIPAVRFLGAMQICIALGVGAGIAAVMAAIWRAKAGDLVMWWAWIGLLAGVAIAFPLLAWSASDTPNDSQLAHAIYFFAFHVPTTTGGLHQFGVIFFAAVTLLLFPIVFFWLRSDYAIRTAYSALAAAALVFAIYGHGDALRVRIHVLPEYDRNHPAELTDIINHLEELPPGRKQAGPGAENHWWNQLPYVYGDRPALLQMGGGGLQASPNYDFLWNTIKQYGKLAWLYDAPYLVFQTASAGIMPAGKAVYDTEHYEIRRIRGGGLIAPIAVTGMLPDGAYGPNTPMRTAALAWLKSEEPEHDRFLAYPGSGPVAPSPGDGKVNRVWRQDSSGDSADIVGEVFQTTPTTYVVRESWHPRWHAYVDGREVPVRRVTPDFPAVDVTSPGKHVIAMRFERPLWAWACWLLWPGLTLGAWLVLRRRRPATAAAV